ncbi:R8 protein [Stygiomarasmius scandens]|uniref:R8 protein n=1 Tax=Marasmiellus scandens TaxID=2682957 RepID=A0ABR1JXR6_9AGAR
MPTYYAHFPEDERPSKRRKTLKPVEEEPELEEARSAQEPFANDSVPEVQMNDDFGLGLDFGGGSLGDDFNPGVEPEPIPYLRSSEEPGQGRQNSRPPSVGGDFNFAPDSNDPNAGGSQRSSLFPWDNAGAGPSSSVDFGPDRVVVDRAETRVRNSPLMSSRRESSLGLSQTGSVGRGISPADLPSRGSQGFGEDFVFDGVDSLGQGNTRVVESQRTEADVASLERTTIDFLESVNSH